MSNQDIGKALAAAFGEIDHAVKNSVNPHFKSDYANLETILDVVRGVYKRHGLAVVQFPGPLKSDSGVFSVDITTTIIHSSGEMIGSTMSMPVNADKNGKITPHAVGSAITFGRRYALAAAAGITQADDDGNAGSSGEDEDTEGKDSLESLRNQITGATTSTALKAIKTLVQDTGDPVLAALFSTRYKELRNKEKV